MKFIIGDIHGEITKLKLLINKIVSMDKNPEFVFIGDYIDKGEDALATLSYLDKLSKSYKCTFLCGNHEFCWMNVIAEDNDTIDYLLKYGGKATLDSLKSKNVIDGKNILIDKFGDFFSNLKAYWIYNDFVAVHSGILPENYQTELKDIPLERLLFNRYDFIKYDHKYMNKYTVIFGHTGFYTPFVNNYRIGIDTAACFLKTQPISAFCIESRSFINSFSEIVSLDEFESDRCPNIIRTNPWRYA